MKPKLFSKGTYDRFVRVLVFSCLFLLILTFAGNIEAGLWQDVGSLNQARGYHTATTLPDGRVLVAGGRDTGGPVLNSAEIYDPSSQSWTPTANLQVGRYYQTAELLANGKVLVVGGRDTTALATVTCELYDPFTGLWSSTGSLNTERMTHSSTLLADGRVLVAGGRTSGTVAPMVSAEIYDPITGTWTATGSLNIARYYHAASLLSNGQVLVSGGRDTSQAVISSAELYDPVTGTWTLTGAMPGNRYLHPSTLLPDGRVLVSGGRNQNSRATTTAYLYDPGSGAWSTTGAMPTARFAHTATLLNDGMVMAVSGFGIGSTGEDVMTPNVDVYDPATGLWTAAGSLTIARQYQTASLLPDGNLLIAGGTTDTYGNVATASAVLYVIDAPNISPIAVDDLYGVEEDSLLTVAIPGILGNDTDPNGDTLTAVQVSDPLNGTLILNANGSFTYMPASNFFGEDSFTYMANDGLADSNIGTVVISVTPINDAPVAESQTIATVEDTPLAITLTATDVEGDDLSYEVRGGPNNGTLSGPAPSLTYTPNANFNGADSFTFVANDNASVSGEATIAITVAPVNDAPVVSPDSYSTNEDEPLTVESPGVLANDSDIDGDDLIAVWVSGPNHGVATLNPDGSFTYMPNANFAGEDSFLYKAYDGALNSNETTVAITVSADDNMPLNPNPADQATNVHVDSSLFWSTPDPLTYDVYFGPSNPPPLVAAGQSAPSYDPPGNLAYGTTYYWQIVARDQGGQETVGPVWSFGTVSIVNVSLDAGWNMVSSAIQPEDPNVTNVLAALSDAFVLMKNGAGQVYWPEQGINQIVIWDVTDGYQIFMREAAILSIAGSPVEPSATPIALAAGWNMVSFLPPAPLLLETALASIEGELYLVKNGVGQVYWPEFGINNIVTMQPAQGYQLYMSSPGTLTYPAN